MSQKVQPFLLYCQSSVHAGSGSELGIVDLPIQREQHTNFPKIESSSLKGAIRAAVEYAVPEDKKEHVPYIFGSSPDDSKNNPLAAAIAVSDAKILFFPVKSFKGVFAWLTCPMVLQRFEKEMKTYYGTTLFPSQIQENTVSSSTIMIKDKAILEEFMFSVQENDNTTKIAKIIQEFMFGKDDPLMDGYFAERVMVVSNEDFLDFVTLSTEVNARIKIDPQTGIVSKGALWNEENTPPETIFYSFAFASKPVKGAGISSEKEVLDFFKDPEVFPEIFQLGGNYTLGRGLLKRIWLNAQGQEE
jgi:CRISPR-associated protein Cmr4